MLNILTLNWMLMGQVLDKHHHYRPIYTLDPIIIVDEQTQYFR